MRRAFFTALVVALLAAAALPAAAAARRGACLPGGAGPRCTIWTGKVIAVDDGDTLDVDLAGDRTSKAVRIRLTGINAMEQTGYEAGRRTGECHAIAATMRLERLVKAGRGVVRLAAQDPASRAGRRLRRGVAVRIRGRWRDVGRVLVADGLALWMPDPVESAWNATYRVLAERAARAAVNLWDPDACGIGPVEGANLRMWVNWDIEGPDDVEVNGEWVKIKNLDPFTAVPLGRWWVRDSSQRRYRFPARATIPAAGEITVYVGTGTSTAGELYWGERFSIFQSASRDARAMGDGAYLFDPDGDLRAFMTYPCVEACSDPNQGAIELMAHPDGRESVTVRNVSPRVVDLEGYRLVSEPHGYAFGADSVLDPGDAMRIEIGDSLDDDNRLLKHWYTSGPILDDAGGTVKLSTFTDMVLACSAWGGRAC